jgi:nucleoid DNA-binding protein
MANYTKKDLIRDLAAETGTSQATAQQIVDGVFSRISERSAAGDKVAIAGFGKFEVKTRAARTGRNPATGASIEIPEKRVMKFTPTKASTS